MSEFAGFRTPLEGYPAGFPIVSPLQLDLSALCSALEFHSHLPAARHLWARHSTPRSLNQSAFLAHIVMNVAEQRQVFLDHAFGELSDGNGLRVLARL